MIGKTTTKLIIVCDDKTKEYANYLRQLISVNDDDDEGQIIGTPDGSVDAAVWSEDVYKDQEKTISSNEHILFIGNNETSQSEIKNMQTKFYQFGMKYGWLGKRAMMQVDDALLSKDEYGGFIDYCSSYKQYFERLAYNEPENLVHEEVPALESPEECHEIETLEQIDIVEKKPGKFAKAISKAASAVLNNVLEPVGEFIEAGAKGAVEGVKAHSAHKKITDQQYRALTVIFYLDGLKEFLEG